MYKYMYMYMLMYMYIYMCIADNKSLNHESLGQMGHKINLGHLDHGSTL